MLFRLTPLQVNSNGNDNLVFEESSFLSPPHPPQFFSFSPSLALLPPPPPLFAAGKRMKVRSWGRDHHISFLPSSLVSIISFHRLNCISLFLRFQQLCEEAFLILRRKGPLLINLFVMMLSAGLPELRSLDDIGYLRKTLLLPVSEDDALRDFRSKFDHAINNSFSTTMNWFAHNVKRDNPWKINYVVFC